MNTDEKRIPDDVRNMLLPGEEVQLDYKSKLVGYYFTNSRIVYVGREGGLAGSDSGFIIPLLTGGAFGNPTYKSILYERIGNVTFKPKTNVVEVCEKNGSRQEFSFKYPKDAADVRQFIMDKIMPPSVPSRTDTSKEFDFFISYASEDKSSIARPLYEALRSRGAEVWFDKRELSVGDSLRKKIEQGLKQSRYGITIISKTYMEKFWTGQELDGLFSLWASGNDKKILPIWHHVSKDEVLKYSPLLSSIIALKSSDHTLEELADKFVPLIQRA